MKCRWCQLMVSRNLSSFNYPRSKLKQKIASDRYNTTYSIEVSVVMLFLFSSKFGSVFVSPSFDEHQTIISTTNSKTSARLNTDIPTQSPSCPPISLTKFSSWRRQQDINSTRRLLIKQSYCHIRKWQLVINGTINIYRNTTN